MALSVGDTAPSFTLLDSDRNEVSLSDYSAKPLIVAFFPAAFSGVCDTEMCTFRDSAGELNDAGVEIVGISTDNLFVAKEFKAKHGLNFPVLSDHTAATARAYDTVIEDFAGMPGYTAANRTVYVVDGSGTIQFVWQGPNPGVEPDYDAVKAAARSLA